MNPVFFEEACIQYVQALDLPTQEGVEDIHAIFYNCV
jgi:hypothetical protein